MTYPDALLTVGPSTKEGFFYDFQSPQKVVNESDYATLQSHVTKIIKAKLPFERLTLRKDEAMELFDYNKFKQYLIDTKVPKGGMTSVYKIGDFIDLCTGPHILSTSQVKAFHISKHSATYWLGDASKDTL